MQQNSYQRKMKVLMLAEYPYIQEDEYLGGVMQASMRLIRALAKSGKVDLYIVTQTLQVKKEERKKEDNLTIIFLPYYFKKNDAVIFYGGFRRRLRRIINELKPDLVHAQGNTQFIFSAIKAPLPHLVTIHGLYRNEMKVFKSRLSRREYFKKLIAVGFEKYYISRINNLIAITSEISDIVRKRSSNVRIFRIDNAIDDNFFSLVNTNNGPVILFVAAITYRKGLHILLKAFVSLARQIPSIKCRIAGVEHWDPCYVNSMKQDYASYIKTGQISFLGPITQKQLYDEMSASSLLCLPSLSESAPMVIAQAMAAGKVVVASRIGGIPDMISEGITGKLAIPGNVDNLVECIANIIVDKEQLRKIGEKAKEAAMKKYYSEAVVAKTIQAYRDIIMQN